MAKSSSIETPSRPDSSSVPSTYDTDGSNCKLLCLVEGDPIPFVVTASLDSRIFDLQQLIYNQKDRGILQDVNASDLILWKVNSFKKLA
jgi:hypothetical protein